MTDHLKEATEKSMDLAEQMKDLQFRSERLRGRLINWKFISAMSYADVFTDDPEAMAVLVALANMYRNSGWFDGEMGLIVGVAVDMLLGRF